MAVVGRPYFPDAVVRNKHPRSPSSRRAISVLAENDDRANLLDWSRVST